MPHIPCLDATLLAAYRATCYRVFIQTSTLDLRIGELNSALDVILTQHQAVNAIWMTAYNPFSTPTPEPVNQAALMQLHAALSLQKLPIFPSRALADLGNWPDEAGYLVIGLTETRARYLLAPYRQHAILWCPKGAPVELRVLTR